MCDSLEQFHTLIHILFITKTTESLAMAGVSSMYNTYTHNERLAKDIIPWKPIMPIKRQTLQEDVSLNRKDLVASYAFSSTLVMLLCKLNVASIQLQPRHDLATTHGTFLAVLRTLPTDGSVAAVVEGAVDRLVVADAA
jgi:hypothetical protein